MPSSNVVIYARYSSDNQREESIEGQLRECRAYAKRNDMKIIGSYIDRALSAMPTDSNLSLCGSWTDSPATALTLRTINAHFPRTMSR